MAKKKPAKNATNQEQVSFEDSMEQLESIVRQLEAGNFGLSDSLQKYEEGVKHLKQCYQLLEQAEKRVQLLTGINADGEPTTQDFDDLATEINVGKTTTTKSEQSRKSPKKPTQKLDKDADSDSVDSELDIDDERTLF